MQTGTILRNRYRILQKLGRGGFGDIYLAEDVNLPRKPRCVVKHLQPQQSNAIAKAQELFQREAETLYKLGKKNEGIPELFAYFEERGQFYIVQEYIEARDISQESPFWSQNSSAVTPQHPRRRRFLSWLLFGGMGFGVAALSGSCSEERSQRVAETKPNVSSSPTANNPPLSAQPLKTQTFTTVKVDSEGQIIERLPGQAEVLAENLGNGVSLEMVSIPGGRFLMGSPESEEGRYENEGPQHYVNVSAFFLGKYPVTQAQYQAVMENNPSDREELIGSNRPVACVSWKEATEFCQKLSQRMGKTYRLPSEAEWEYACRAGTTTPFYFGETLTRDLVNYDGSSAYASGPEGVYRGKTTDVGSFPPNAFGLYDMHGNVWELCQDFWHENYNGAPTDGSAWVSGDYSFYRMQRGGSWMNSAANCRSAYRDRGHRDVCVINTGFRVVLVLGV